MILAYPGEVTHMERVPRPTPQQPVKTVRPDRMPRVQGHLNVGKIARAEKQFHAHIVAASQKHRVDPALVKAIILAESGYDPNAVSPKGAVGLMQLMPRTADALGAKDSFDPKHNINAGVKYLSTLIAYFEGNLHMAVAAYNAGIQRIESRRTIPRATQRFVRTVLEYYDYYRWRMEQPGNGV
ncbi:MAG: transglycosylase SLT domain-containing protein [Deltaproteobacteria bacterium]|nr:transglycosylase SLT domain-containing protein [Deltaproteobacteria bacterium]